MKMKFTLNCLWFAIITNTVVAQTATFKWAKSIGGTTADGGRSIALDASGNVYITGKFSGTVDFDPSSNIYNLSSSGSDDIFMSKLDASGNFVWAKRMGGIDVDGGTSIVVDASGNSFVSGYFTGTADFDPGSASYNMTSVALSDIFITKLDASGNFVWAKRMGGTGGDQSLSLTQDSNGNLYTTGIYTQTADFDPGTATFNLIPAGLSDIFISKLDATGNFVWARTLGGSSIDEGYFISVDLSGNVYTTGRFNGTADFDPGAGIYNLTSGGSGDVFVSKLNSSGDFVWAKRMGSTSDDCGRSLAIDETGNVYITGRFLGTVDFDPGIVISNFYSNGNEDVFISKLDPLGNFVWAKTIGGTGTDEALSITIDQSGNVYSNGYFQGLVDFDPGLSYHNLMSSGSTDIFITKLDALGNFQWAKSFGGIGNDYGHAIIIDLIGYVYTTGQFLSNVDFNPSQSSFDLISAGSSDIFIHKMWQPLITGLVWQDLNQNCIKEFSENGVVNGINFIVQPGNVVTQSNNGFWAIDSLPAGNYAITIDTTNLNYQITCAISQAFNISDPSIHTNGPNFGVMSTNPCSEPDITLYAPFLRPCLPNQMIYVQACNQTTATGILNASYVDVELDPLMTVMASSIPYTIQSPNVYRFQTGNMNPGQCVNFSLATTISSPTIGCASLLGQTLCMDAALYPVQSCALDTIPSNPPSGGGGSTGGGTLDGLPEPCTLPWDQSSLSLDGWCQNDTIYFTITNTGELGGGDMECYSPLWVTVDGVVTFTDSIMIQGGQTITYSFPGDGATWILNAAQHPLHPGNSNPNAHVEACGDTINWTPDNVNDFPLDDADPVVDIYCGLVTGSYDPNDKTGYPNGATDQNYIQPNQQLQYVIRFQNTGTDTAFTVVIRDTLDTDLNIFTVTPGVSSHNYEFRMYGPRVLEWTFNNILLPDSTTNEPESNGFVTFHLEQVPDLAPGTEITNDADIYFDFNDPITTNTTMHRIYEGFVAVAHLEEMSKETSGLSVYPNPSNGQFTLLLDKEGPENYSLYDQQGRVVKVGSLTGKKTTIALELNNGMYFLKVGNKVAKVQVAK
jgi:uncharacterized repeat protein (TIGR01451 family)